MLSPPLRRFFYVCMMAGLVMLGCRAVNAEPTGAGAAVNFPDLGSMVAKPCRRCIVKPHGESYGQPSGKSGDLIAVASRYLGSRNPTRQRGPWCGHFLNLVLQQAGLAPMPGNRAIDALRLGPRLPRAVPGSLIVRRHHVEISLGDGRSISGNWHGRVAIHASSRGVVIQPSRM